MKRRLDPDADCHLDSGRIIKLPISISAGY
jgi:hypothetical protein